MNGKIKSTAVTLVLVGVALGVNWACPKCPETPTEPTKIPPSKELIEPTRVHEIQIGVAEAGMSADEIYKVRIDKITVHRGEAVRITSRGLHAYFFIPDGGLETFGIGENICDRTDDWIACKVERGNGIGVYVPMGYRPDLLEKNHVIWYSVLVSNDELLEYQHGVEKSSPPEFIIPKGIPN
jgi:hypothetical protein